MKGKLIIGPKFPQAEIHKGDYIYRVPDFRIVHPGIQQLWEGLCERADDTESYYGFRIAPGCDSQYVDILSMGIGALEIEIEKGDIDDEDYFLYSSRIVTKTEHYISESLREGSLFIFLESEWASVIKTTRESNQDKSFTDLDFLVSLFQNYLNTPRVQEFKEKTKDLINRS